MLTRNPMMNERNARPLRRIAGTLIVALAAAGLTFAFGTQSAQAQSDSESAAIEHAYDLSSGFKKIARQVRPSVVNIRSTKRIMPASAPFGGKGGRGFEQFREFFGDDMFRRFFDSPGGSGQRGYERNGIGSGVIVSEDGYILTNNHVIEGADEITVTLYDEREFKAEVVGNDARSDLAVLKIDADGLSFAVLGDSDAAEVGDWVVAVGSPMGLEQSVTAGIISAKGRVNLNLAEFENFIQTDAAINPGNSGGPLVTLDGKVVGINTAIATRSGGSQGIGFAIPSNMAKSIMGSIIAEGRVVRGWLGVRIQNLDEGMAASFGFDGEGVLVADVQDGSPAEAGGMEDGDIIMQFGAKKVGDVLELKNTVAAASPKEKIAVKVFRNGKRRTLKIKLGELGAGDDSDSESEASKEEAVNAEVAKLGLMVDDLTPEKAEEFGFEGEGGAVVVAVEPFSPAARAGLRPGDVIVQAQGKAIGSEKDFANVAADADLEQGLRLQVFADDFRRFVFLKMDSED